MSDSEDQSDYKLRKKARTQHRLAVQNAVREQLKGEIDATSIMAEARVVITKDVTNQIVKTLAKEIERQVSAGVREALTKISIIEILKLKIAEKAAQVAEKFIEVKVREDHW